MSSSKKERIQRSRELRKGQTRAEKRLWWILRGKKFLGYKFRRQYLYKSFIIDFYCPRLRLGIELDGEIHRERKDYDWERQLVIEQGGIKLLRFSNDELFKDPVQVLDKISQALPLGPLLEEERGDRERKPGWVRW